MLENIPAEIIKPMTTSFMMKADDSESRRNGLEDQSRTLKHFDELA